MKALACADQRGSMASDFGPGASELSSLKAVEDGDILANTQARYDAGHIYTRSGRLLLAVNPYKQLPLYKPETLEAYRHSLQPQAELPPHVYAVASSAHSGMLRTSTSQVSERGVTAPSRTRPALEGRGASPRAPRRSRSSSPASRAPARRRPQRSSSSTSPR